MRIRKKGKVGRESEKGRVRKGGRRKDWLSVDNEGTVQANVIHTSCGCFPFSKTIFAAPYMFMYIIINALLYEGLRTRVV